MFSSHAARLRDPHRSGAGRPADSCGSPPFGPEPLWNSLRHGSRRAGRRAPWSGRHAHEPDISGGSADDLERGRRVRLRGGAGRNLQRQNRTAELQLLGGDRHRDAPGRAPLPQHRQAEDRLAHGDGVGDGPARYCPDRFRRKERTPHVGADSERSDGRTVHCRVAQTPSRHDAHFRRDEQQSRDSTARSSGSTATATAASRARSATSPATGRAPTRSTSSSTAPTPPIRAATAPRR